MACFQNPNDSWIDGSKCQLSVSCSEVMVALSFSWSEILHIMFVKQKCIRLKDLSSQYFIIHFKIEFQPLYVQVILGNTNSHKTNAEKKKNFCGFFFIHS